ncbi:MAG: hypothetical protein AAGI11_15390 [Pseudomonadota bacterium]
MRPSLLSIVAAGLSLASVALALLGWTFPAVLAALVSSLLSLMWVLRGRWQAAPLCAVAASLALCIHIWQPGAVGLSLFVLAWLLSVALLWVLPVPHLSAPGGPHLVGVRAIELSDEGRDAHWTDPPERPRRIQAYIWYPAQPAKGSRAARYLTDREAVALSASLKVLGLPSFINQHLKLARTHSHRDAPALPGKYPLLVFNHGGALWPLVNTALMEELASHGYAVCSLAHPGESAGIAWADGSFTSIGRELVARMKQVGEELGPYASMILCQDPVQKRAYFDRLTRFDKDVKIELARNWAADSVSLVTALYERPADVGLGDLVQHLDLAHRAYLGMSLGGAASHEACHLDPEALACINIDGMNWCFDRVDQHTPAAVLQIYGDPMMSMGQLQRYVEPGVLAPTELHPGLLMYNDFYYSAPEERGERADLHRVVVRGAGHMAFTDKALNIKGRLRRLLGLGTLDGARAVQVLNALCLSFLDCHVAEARPCHFSEAVNELPEVLPLAPLRP